jgi:hypothetical protein
MVLSEAAVSEVLFDFMRKRKKQSRARLSLRLCGKRLYLSQIFLRSSSVPSVVIS